MILWPPGSPQMGIFSAVDQRPWDHPWQAPANLSTRLRNLSCLNT
jgi:hypothetical protein